MMPVAGSSNCCGSVYRLSCGTGGLKHEEQMLRIGANSTVLTSSAATTLIVEDTHDDTCTCESPLIPMQFTQPVEVLDAILFSEAALREKRREEIRMEDEKLLKARRENILKQPPLVVRPPLLSPFCPNGLPPLEIKQEPLFMEKDTVVSSIREELQKQRREKAETEAALQEAELAALELKLLLQKVSI
ncbi:T. brucei spp.-specific protein [Trypanosoma brucei gambiense DAL972]|uniref:T. brucei spp.-specific protein n=2 Tax=Trypanosoma brucei TaxID=5691 RepID=C9ZNQ3_TRYB9|nr:T. brucei spp.-specific protein [Trypanosoma brucei gambiense DAL972]RHW72490.1 hypothetical protein DPX39_050018300 [Trypanosoma brucei equiperdum]CBH11031.1 T. brucei spp.-specific protein [Trypanosoma brucei gambiense DAL972]|eukprot:XP_011773318.1 T. brucei spp.-specific protein [Trypanosoma brucei gambiense DAL972]